MAHLTPTKIKTPWLYSFSSFLDAESSARLESKIRQLLTQRSPEKVVDFYSRSRKFFLEKLTVERPSPYQPHANLERKLWGISFRSPLYNAAGMCKEGRGYELAAQQGAGAYLAGTATAIPSLGFPLDNQKSGVPNPFTPLPRSEAAINKLGLPNPGDQIMQQRLQEIEKKKPDVLLA